MNSNVEQIKERLSIVDVLSAYITLIPAGKQFKAKCPFHNERTASFSISPDRGLYYCFGCGARGDAFTFVEQFEGVDFNGALKILADKAGVSLDKKDHRADDHAPVYEFLEQTTLRYQKALMQHSEALRYLRGRGLTDQTIAEFRLGYAPDEWRFVADTCTSDAERKIAERAGLIKTPEAAAGTSAKTPYDRFRRRIIFPLCDSSGRVVGFSGRLFPDVSPEDVKGQPVPPKYLNSPETEVFQKSRILFGFDKAKFHIKRHGFSILVEGQMDLVMSHQAGFRNTIATSGTAVSEQSSEDSTANLAVVSRLAPHIFLAFDGDSAGQKALKRAALVALSLGMNPKVVALPEGVDPADFLLRHEKEEWKHLLKESLHFILHEARAVRDMKLSPHLLVQSLRERIFPYLSRVISPIEQQLYTEAVARELGIDVFTIEREHARFVADEPDARGAVPREAVVSEAKNTISSRERIAGCLERFPSQALTAFAEKLSQESIGGHQFGAIVLNEDRRAIVLATIEEAYGELKEDERNEVCIELIKKARDDFYLQIQALLSHELRVAEGEGDEARIEETLKLLMDLNNRRQASFLS